MVTTLYYNPDPSLPTVCFACRRRKASQGIFFKARRKFSIQNSSYWRAIRRLQTGFCLDIPIPSFGINKRGILTEEGEYSCIQIEYKIKLSKGARLTVTRSQTSPDLLGVIRIRTVALKTPNSVNEGCQTTKRPHPLRVWILAEVLCTPSRKPKSETKHPDFSPDGKVCRSALGGNDSPGSKARGFLGPPCTPAALIQPKATARPVSGGSISAKGRREGQKQGLQPPPLPHACCHPASKKRRDREGSGSATDLWESRAAAPAPGSGPEGAAGRREAPRGRLARAASRDGAESNGRGAGGGGGGEGRGGEDGQARRRRTHLPRTRRHSWLPLRPALPGPGVRRLLSSAIRQQ